MKGCYIFSSIKDTKRIKIILFMNENIYNKSDNIIFCNYYGVKKYQSRAYIVHYSSVHEKYFNLFCDLSSHAIDIKNMYIANKNVELFNPDNTNRFIEFIEYYRNFGADKFIVHNTNCSKSMIYYEKKRFHLWKHNDCFHRYKYYSKRIIFTDHVEIIHSSLYSNSASLFTHLNNKSSSFFFFPKLTITKGKGFFYFR